MKALVLSLLFILVAANEAKEYSKCELASHLKASGMDGYYGFSLGDCEFPFSFSPPEQVQGWQGGSKMGRSFQE